MKRTAYLLLLGGYGVLRIAELVHSRRHERALDDKGLERRRERGFPVMVAAHLVPFVVGPLEAIRRARRGRTAAGPLATGLSLAALAGALGVRAWVLRTLGESWNVRVHGGPGMEVVDGGPYRWVRHPNYAAVIVELAALPLAGGAWATALLASALNALALYVRIGDEEAMLAEVPAWRERMLGKPRFVPLSLRRERFTN